MMMLPLLISFGFHRQNTTRLLLSMVVVQGLPFCVSKYTVMEVKGEEVLKEGSV